MRTIAITNFVASLVLGAAGIMDVAYGVQGFGVVMLWISGANFGTAAHCWARHVGMTQRRQVEGGT